MASGGARLLPWYFGAAYYDVSQAQTIYYPMPLNWIVRWWMAAGWAWLQFRHEAPAWVPYSSVSRLLHEQFERGRETREMMGYKRGWDAAFDRLLAEVDGRHDEGQG